tara:strand:- start:2 stop:637 length:636 start_codon:yes stop_codon:yes gene_type:complete
MAYCKEKKRIADALRYQQLKDSPILYEEHMIKKREYSRERYNNNREKIYKEIQEYKKKNPEKVKKWNAKTWQKNKVEQGARNAIYIKKYRSENIEMLRKKDSEYAKNNPEKMAHKSAKRRARIKNAIPDWLKDCPSEDKRLKDIYLLSRIYECKDGVKRHVDHMWPLDDGGPHWSGNLQILTGTENNIKYNKVCPIQKKQIQLNLEEARVL